MPASKSDLIDQSDEVWQRLRSRLDGLGDEEYLWEPAPGCWTIRPRPDGVWRADWPLPPPDPAPFTTIAWRLWHLVDMYGEDRAPRWLDLPPDGPAIGDDDPEGAPSPTAAGAVEMLERAHDRWDRHLAAVPDERLSEPVGEVGGGFAERSRAAYVLHMLDEFIHHGAEVGVLRDLWRAQQGTYSEDPLEERVMRGDHGVLDLLRAGRDGAGSGDHPDLVAIAAAYGRWDLAVELARLGLRVDGGERPALHLAAGAGELSVVQELVDLGADLTATDAEFHATPLQWALFLERPAMVEWLAARPENGGTAERDGG